MENTFESYLPSGFHCFYKSEQHLSVQNEAELLQIRIAICKFAQIYYKLVQLLQIGAIIINQCTTHGESNGPNFIKIEDYIYFEMNIFHNILQDNVHEQVFS